MNKNDLITSIASKSGLTKKDSKSALEAVIEAIEETLASGEKVQLVGFGTFEPRERAERMGRNPKTGEEIKIEARTVPFFTSGKTFKERIKEGNK